MSARIIEQAIIRRLLTIARDNGFSFDLWDFNQSQRKPLVERTVNPEAILKEMFSVDDERIQFYKSGIGHASDYAGFVFLVHGNGSTVISDYSTGLDGHGFIEAANELSDEIDRDEDKWVDAYFENVQRLIRASRDMVLCHSHPDAPDVEQWWEHRIPEYEDMPQTRDDVRKETLAQLSKALDKVSA
jgi:hypothetical protein